MYRQRLSALFFVFVGALAALVLPRGDSVRAIGDALAAANWGLGSSTAFTYQGGLEIDGARVSGAYDFQFSLWNAASGGSRAGSTLTHEDVTVDEGRFTVLLDFGDVFDGSNRYLEIAVRPGDSSGAFTTLSPRQTLTPTPYAAFAAHAAWTGLQGVPPGFADDVDGVEYANVIVVAKSGGDFTSIQAALDSISDAAADNPYLVWVAPGVYEKQVTLEPYVTLQGAGEGATIVRGIGGNQHPWDGPDSATLVGADNATVRHLTVESNAVGTDQYAVAIYNNNASPTLDHVTATALGSSSDNIGVYNENASPLMTNVTATTTGGDENLSVFNYKGSSPRMTHVTTTASGGNHNFGVTNNSSSPVMNNVTATVSGGEGSINYGVYNFSSSSPRMTNVTATATGGTVSYGVYNYSSSSPVMNNVTATASGGRFNTGVENEYWSSPTMTNVTATGSGGSSENYGVYNLSSSSPVIRDSRLEGITNSVYRDGTGTVQVANSQLIGTVDDGVTCYDNYDENLAPVSCPSSP